MTVIELRVAAILLGACAFILAAMFSLAVLRSARRKKRGQVSADLMPDMRSALVDYLAGSSNLPRLRAFLDESRSTMSDAILSFQSTVGGSGRDRLCELSIDLSLLQDWMDAARSKDVLVRRKAFTRLAFVCTFEPCRRSVGEVLLRGLEDDDREVRVLAANSLVQSGDVRDIEQVFDIAVSQNLLTRILLIEDLRRHSSVLCERAVPEILRSGDPARILITLETLTAFERALPLPDLYGAMDHSDRKIRIQALRLAPMVIVTPQHRASILAALADEDSEVSSTAALAAGRLKIEEALPILSRTLRVGGTEPARRAASALAEMPPRGWETLEELSASSNPVTAAAASDALARARRKAGV